MNPVQYIILNKGLNMSTGKAAAQAAHASVEGVRLSAKEPNGNPWDSSIVNRWYRGGQYAKIVLEVPDSLALHTTHRYITDRGFKATMIIDEGRTEFGGVLTPTAIGVEIVDKNFAHTADTFGQFKLYSDFWSNNSTIYYYDSAPLPTNWERFKAKLIGKPGNSSENPNPRSQDGNSAGQCTRDT